MAEPESSQQQLVARFRQLHRKGQPLLLANAWDAGSAKVFASLGFEALATTSSGFAATLGRFDGAVTRDESLAHATAVVSAVDVPVSADLENGFADDPTGVAETVRRALDAGLAGCSIEDSTGRRDEPIYPFAAAVDRVTAAVEAATLGPGLVLTARAESYLHGRPDLADTISRLQAFQDAGADVVYAPGLVAIDDIRAVVTSVDVPVNVLALPTAPNVAELAAAGVARISVGGAFAYVALAAAAEAGRELLDAGTYQYWEQTAKGQRRVRDAFVGEPRVGPMTSNDQDLTTFEQAIAVVLSTLRAGDVVTYGEVATEAGYPGRARAVGAFLAARGSDYPSWRVVTSTGRLVPGHEREHRRRLQAEGVAVTDRVKPDRRDDRT